MPRKKRLILSNIPHHVLQRGNNRQDIFHDEEDRRYYLSKLIFHAHKNKVRIGAYCLMTNHVHLLVYPEVSEALPWMMKGVSQLYSQYTNRKYKRSGKLWENRYKMHFVDPDHAWTLARYIEKNPVRACMVGRAEDYVYSSAKAHLLESRDPILSIDILRGEAVKYREFFDEDPRDERETTFQIRSNVQQEKAFGGAGFVDNLERFFKACFKIRSKGRPAKSVKQTGK